MNQRPSSSGQPRLFDSGFFFLLGLALVTGALAIWLKGFAVLSEAARQMNRDLLTIIPALGLGVLVGAMFSLLLPRHLVSRLLGGQTRFRGIFLASILGALMPGGVMTSIPLLLALGRSGAGAGALMAFLVSWSAVGIQRLLIWELPFMGAEFSMIRFVSSLPLPILAGLSAQYLAENVPALRVQLD